jgi:hypothetical protein
VSASAFASQGVHIRESGAGDAVTPRRRAGRPSGACQPVGTDAVPWVSPALGRHVSRQMATQVRKDDLREARAELARLRSQVALLEELSGRPLSVMIQSLQIRSRRYGR